MRPLPLVLAMLGLFAFSGLVAQDQISEEQTLVSKEDSKENTVAKEQTSTYLFGYISDTDDYEAVMAHIETLGGKVLGNCEQEKLIYVQVTEKHKDPMDLFYEIELSFRGTCYYKSSENRMIKYSKCHDQELKIQLKK